jgi:hypothetical protein
MALQRPLDFVNLPTEIHYLIAQVFDPTILTGNVSSTGRPDQTLARLSLVCRRLYREYAPFSTWKYVYLNGKSDYWRARVEGVAAAMSTLSLSPALERILDNPSHGIHARELFIEYAGQWNRTESFSDDPLHESSYELKTQFTSLVALTPHVRAVRCAKLTCWDVAISDTLIASLTRLPELHTVSLRCFDLQIPSPMPLPPLHQVRSLKLATCAELWGLSKYLTSMSRLQELVIADRLPHWHYEIDSMRRVITTNAKTLRLDKLVIKLPLSHEFLVDIANHLRNGSLRELVVRLSRLSGGNVEDVKLLLKEILPQTVLTVDAA